MNEAIKLAIEKGGYEGYKLIGNTFVQNNPYIQSLKEITLDPLFWQALGKALGWKGNQSSSFSKIQIRERWLKIALLYTETVLTGGDTEELWKELLKEETSQAT